jgi:hypothetical protein
MATVVRIPPCDGYRVRLGDALVGVVEESWLDGADELAGLAVRLPGGLRALLLAGDVQAVLEDEREVVAAPRARLLELTVPRVEAAADGRVAAHWETTGEVLAPSRMREPLRARLGVQIGRPDEPTRPVWQTVALLYAVLAVLTVLVIGLAFVVAILATGSAY